MNEKEMLARQAIGWAPQVRHWRLQEQLGHAWVKSAREHAEQKHREAMATVDGWVSDHPEWFR